MRALDGVERRRRSREKTERQKNDEIIIHKSGICVCVFECKCKRTRQCEHESQQTSEIQRATNCFLCNNGDCMHLFQLKFIVCYETTLMAVQEIRHTDTMLHTLHYHTMEWWM